LAYRDLLNTDDDFTFLVNAEIQEWSDDPGKIFFFFFAS